jgi:hypothetical protein
VLFHSVKFLDKSHYCAGFVDTAFLGQVVFDATIFNGRSSFYNARFHNILTVNSNCEFKGPVDFENARLMMLKADGRDTTRMPFSGLVSFRGCTYQRVSFPGGSAGFWRMLSENLRRQGEQQFDRQPYLEFEKFCRMSGEGEIADEVYFEMCKRESWLEKRPLYRILDIFYRVVFGYGVRPGRWIGWIIGLWGWGAAMFSLPGMMKLGAGGATEGAGGRFLPQMFLSVSNLVPGADKLMSKYSELLNQEALAAVGVAMIQRAAGWVLLALLAKRFFAGLKTQQ